MPLDTSSRTDIIDFSDPFYTNRPPSPNIMVNHGRGPEVVCQVQDHAGGFDDTIELKVKPKRRSRRMTIIYRDDDYDSDEADVVVKPTRATSRRRTGKKSKRQPVEDSSSSSSSESDSESDSDSDFFSEEEFIVKKKKSKKMVKASKGRREKGSKKKTSRNDKREEKPRETLTQAHSAVSLASIQTVVMQPISLYIPVGVSSAPPTSTSFVTAKIPRVEPVTRPVSAPVPVQAPTPRHESRPEPEPTTSRPLTALAFARRLGHLAPWLRLLGAKNGAHPKPRASKAGYKSHIETPSSDESPPERHGLVCEGCDNLRSEYWQVERHHRGGRDLKPSLCGNCRHKLRSAYNKVHGPRGQDLSTMHWCRVCGFLRSGSFHKLHGEPSATLPPLNNTCQLCVDEEKRKAKIREGKRRATEGARLTDKYRRENDMTLNSPETAERAFSTGSALWTARNGSDSRALDRNANDKQKADDLSRRRSPYRPPTAVLETESSADEDSPRAQPAKQTLRRSRTAAGTESVTAATDHTGATVGSTIPAPTNEQPEKIQKPSDSSQNSKKSNKVRFTGREQASSTRQASSSSSGSKKNTETTSPSYVTAAGSRKSSHASSSKYNTTAKARDSTTAEPTAEPISKTESAAKSHNVATEPNNGADSGGSGSGSGSGSGGFRHNSNESWARLDIDETLMEAFGMDPQERAARKARLMGMSEDSDSTPTRAPNRAPNPTSTPSGGPGGCRVWEIETEDDA